MSDPKITLTAVWVCDDQHLHFEFDVVIGKHVFRGTKRGVRVLVEHVSDDDKGMYVRMEGAVSPAILKQYPDHFDLLVARTQDIAVKIIQAEAKDFFGKETVN